MVAYIELNWYLGNTEDAGSCWNLANVSHPNDLVMTELEARWRRTLMSGTNAESNILGSAVDKKPSKWSMQK